MIRRHRSTIAVVTVSTLLVLSCATDRSAPQDFMPAPELYAAGIVEPLHGSGDRETTYPPGILFATTRRPAPPGEETHYLNQGGDLISLGMAQVILPPDIAASGEPPPSNPQGEDGQERDFEVIGVVPLGVLAPSDLAEGQGSGTVEFVEAIDRQLAGNPVREIHIYIHGFYCRFDEPVLVAMEYRYYLGNRGVFVAFSWPSEQSVIRYLSDVQCAGETADSFIRFLELLSAETTAERINIIAHSTGAKLLTEALCQLAQRYGSLPAETAMDITKLGKVITVAGDVERPLVWQLIEECGLNILESFTVYMSRNDGALKASEFLFSKPRIGQTWPEGSVKKKERDLIESCPKMNFIDVSGSAGNHGYLEHEYFRVNPGVSSDILAHLAFNLDPQARGLVRRGSNLYWSFPEDYIERLRAGIAEETGLLE